MTTAGLDFFDQDFFQHQIVALCDYPISKMKWDSSINDQMITEWKLENTVANIDETIARTMLSNFSADALTLPFAGDHKIRHYFEQALVSLEKFLIDCDKFTVDKKQKLQLRLTSNQTKYLNMKLSNEEIESWL